MDRLSVQDLNLKGKKVLLRVDFNVPQDEEGNITDDSRIIASLPTIKYILEQGGSCVLLSHLGRPKGKVDPKCTLAPCAVRLGELLGRPVKMAPDSIGPKVEEMARTLKPGQVLLLENLRFYPAEEKPEADPEFAKKLASLGDLYVNDAFGTAHRAHSSTFDLPKLFPDEAAAGFLMEKEIRFLGDTLRYPKHPFYMVIGGAKISTKIGVLKSLLPKVDGILIGGAMAYTFLKAQGVEIGDSLYEPEFLDEARKILESFLSAGKLFLLPIDLVVANKIAEDASYRTITVQEGVPLGYQGVDIGPKTIQRFQEALKSAQTVLWNGPMGVFEVKPFTVGTYAIAQTLAESKAITIVGGGDSAAAVKKAHLSHEFSHLSTGGGASLEFLEKQSLPGIEALTKL